MRAGRRTDMNHEFAPATSPDALRARIRNCRVVCTLPPVLTGAERSMRIVGMDIHRVLGGSESRPSAIGLEQPTRVQFTTTNKSDRRLCPGQRDLHRPLSKSGKLYCRYKVCVPARCPSESQTASKMCGGLPIPEEAIFTLPGLVFDVSDELWNRFSRNEGLTP